MTLIVSGDEPKDMTGDEYVERILKEAYKESMVSLLKEAITTGGKEYVFIYSEINDPEYVTRIELDKDLDFLTEEPPNRSYMPSHPKYEIVLESLLEYCGASRIAIFGTREWYEKEVAPELQTMLDVVDL